MLHLRRAGLLDTQCKTVIRRDPRQLVSTGGRTAHAATTLRKNLRDPDGIDPDDVIMSPGPRPLHAASPPPSVSPSATSPPKAPSSRAPSIDPTLIDADEIYRHLGPANVFISEDAAIHAIKNGEIR